MHVAFVSVIERDKNTQA